MVIISDASPIIALSNIGRLELLHEVYGEVYITDIVSKEVDIPLPNWLKEISNYDKELYTTLCINLDEGEASSIALGVKMKDRSILIIDERRGRKIATELGLEIIGLLGVIVKAKLEEE